MLFTAEPGLQPLLSLLEEEQTHISELKIQSAEEGAENLGHSLLGRAPPGRHAWKESGLRLVGVRAGGEMGAPGRYFRCLGKWEAKLIVEGEEDDILYKVLLKR